MEKESLIKDILCMERSKNQKRQLPVDSDTENEEEDEGNDPLDLDSTDILACLPEVPHDLKDEGDHDAEGLPTIPEGLRAFLPKGTLKVVLSDSTRDRLIVRAPGFNGLTRLLNLELPETLNRQIPEREKNLGSHLSAAKITA
ncbi:hypothetical protein DFS34DRAFT_590355 [Phlyctochytrium arcticum]|nr:hypothetical protein DFS34DRAFT_590355 [Phlyctochytrium arcticum]